MNRNGFIVPVNCLAALNLKSKPKRESLVAIFIAARDSLFDVKSNLRKPPAEMTDFLSLLSQEYSDDMELDESMTERIHQYAEDLFLTSSPFVATKEIDVAINYSAYVLSTAINMALFSENWVQMPHNTY